MLGAGGHLTDSGIHINGHRFSVRTPTRGPDPPERFTQGLVYLADMTPCERTKKRPQCGWGHHLKRQHPLGGTGPQPISMINMGPTHQHRRHQDSTLRPGWDPPTRSPRRTVSSSNRSNPNRDINVPATNNPASATNDPSSNTTPNRSTSLFGMLLATTPDALTPTPPTKHRWIQA